MAVNFKFNRKSIKNFERRLEYALRGFADAGVDAMDVFLDLVLEESQKEVPVDTGSLRESAYKSGPERNYVKGYGFLVRGRVGYGGPANRVNPKHGRDVNQYVVPVHERLDVRHSNGKAKFLEDPMNRLSREWDDVFGEQFSRSFRRLFK